MIKTWNRAAAVAELRGRLWRYVSGHAFPYDVEPVLEDLWQLPRGELRRLSASHLALSRATSEMLLACERLLRGLPSSVVRSEVELVGAVRGPVVWERTLSRRRRTSEPTLFVCRPPERRYDTALARLIQGALKACVELEHQSALTAGELNVRISELGQRAHKLLRHPKLADLGDNARISERSLNRLGAHPSTSGVVEFLRRYREAVVDQDSAVIQDVLGGQLLAPASDDVLFELLVGFAIEDALVSDGFEQQQIRLFPGSAIPLATLHRGGQSFRLWWQRPVWSVMDVPQASRYHDVLSAAKMRLSTLRPDLVLVDDAGARLLMVEVKHTVREATPERTGVREMLSYLEDAQSLLEGRPEPHGLVVAWNATGVPAQHRVLISGQERIGEAVDLTMSMWCSAA